MSESRELFLIRHGQSTANASGVWQGTLDFPLSDEGREQARLTGRALSSEHPFDGFYASPLSRAFETARIIASEAGYERETVPVDGLIERAGGIFEGNTWAEREETMPRIVEKFRNASEEDGWKIIGAETDEELRARFAPAISQIMSRHRTGSRVIIVSHGGVMRAYLRDLFGEEVFSGARRAGNASITRIEWPDAEEPRLIELAATNHLPDATLPEARTSE